MLQSGDGFTRLASLQGTNLNQTSDNQQQPTNKASPWKLLYRFTSSHDVRFPGGFAAKSKKQAVLRVPSDLFHSEAVDSNPSDPPGSSGIDLT